MKIRADIPALRNVIREVRTSLHEGARMTEVLNLVAYVAASMVPMFALVFYLLDRN